MYSTRYTSISLQHLHSAHSFCIARSQVEQLRARLASLYARQMPASDDDIVELRSSTLGFLRSAVGDLDAQLFAPLSRAIARLPHGAVHHSLHIATTN